jgi:hypothetical protein
LFAAAVFLKYEHALATLEYHSGVAGGVSAFARNLEASEGLAHRHQFDAVDVEVPRQIGDPQDRVGMSSPVIGCAPA